MEATVQTSVNDMKDFQRPRRPFRARVLKDGSGSAGASQRKEKHLNVSGPEKHAEPPSGNGGGCHERGGE